MAPPFRKNIDHVRFGEPGKAAVPRRPDQQLEQNLAYLKDRVDGADLGTGLFIRDATLAAGSLVGQPVYYNSTTQQFELALAAAEQNSTTGTIFAADSSYVVGIIKSKANDTLGDILVLGTDTVDISAAVDGAILGGPYYLSAAEAGKLVQQRPGVAIAVLTVIGTGEVLVVPDVKDFAEDHIHFKHELTQTQAADSSEMGWLPADDAVFNGLAPTGAAFGYNISAHAELEKTYPPIPVEAAQLVWDRSDGTLGKIVPDGPNGLVQFTQYGIWWMTDCDTMKPWDPYDAGSESSSSCPWPEPSRLTLYFIRMTLGAAKSVVNSITSLKPNLLQVLDGDGDSADRGDIRLDLLLGMIQQDDAVAGYQVIKNLDTDSQELQRGPVVEGLFAGTNVTLTSDEQLDVSGVDLHQGRVTVNADAEIVTTLDSNEEGYEVFKVFNAAAQELRGGPVVEGIFKGTNITITSSEVLDVSGNNLHMGRLTLNAAPPVRDYIQVVRIADQTLVVAGSPVEFTNVMGTVKGGLALSSFQVTGLAVGKMYKITCRALFYSGSGSASFAPYDVTAGKYIEDTGGGSPNYYLSINATTILHDQMMWTFTPGSLTTIEMRTYLAAVSPGVNKYETTMIVEEVG